MDSLEKDILDKDMKIKELNERLENNIHENNIQLKKQQEAFEMNDFYKDKFESIDEIFKEKDAEIKHLKESMDFLVFRFKSHDGVDIYPLDYYEKCKVKVRFPRFPSS